MSETQSSRIDLAPSQHGESDLAPPPRAVPWAIQWQLLPYRIVFLIGGVFVLVSLLAFIIPQLAAGNRFESPWQLFPFLHLVVGLGMMAVPLLAWRRRVDILRRGLLAPARIVAIQDQGTRSHLSEQAHGVRNLAGPWLEYDAALAQAQQFWNRTVPAAPPGSVDSVALVLKGFGCLLMGFGLFGVMFTVAGLIIIWFNQRAEFADKSLQSLLLLGFMMLYLGAAWLMSRWVKNAHGCATGKLSVGAVGVPAIVRCRFVYSAPNEGESEATAYIDLRQRLQAGQANPADLAVYLPDNPQRVLLLGGLWPPISIQNGKWVRA